jgi:hypothetical protein
LGFEGVAVSCKCSFPNFCVIVLGSSARERKELTNPQEFDCTTEAILSILDICVVVHPYDHVVNSVIVGRVKPRGP